MRIRYRNHKQFAITNPLPQFQQQMTQNLLNTSSDYLQVNYTKGDVYKIDHQINNKSLLIKEQENLRDYLYEVNMDRQKQAYFNQNIKSKLFNLVTDQVNSARKQGQQKEKFDPVEYIEFLEQKGKRIRFRRQNHPKTNFSQHVSSIKFIDQESISLPKVTDKLSAVRSIDKLLESSVRLSKSQKNHKKVKSRNQIDKLNEKIIKSQRNEILNIIQKSKNFDRKSYSSVHDNSDNNMSVEKQLQLMSNKQKYSMDFISYSQLKNKKLIDKYLFEKHIKKPQRKIQKFQDFILKQVKFSTQHKHKIQKFFIKMRQDFNKVQKYTKKSSQIFTNHHQHNSRQ